MVETDFNSVLHAIYADFGIRQGQDFFPIFGSFFDLVKEEF